VQVRIRGVLACLLTVGALPAAASESDIVLANHPGRAQVQAACSMCLSLVYIVMNWPIQDQAGWEKTVRKMVTVYGAPLTAEESAAIIAYLASHYGK
jgi:hypothetical protein